MIDLEKIRQNLDNLGFHHGQTTEFLEADLLDNWARLTRGHAYQSALSCNGVMYTCCIHGQEGRNYPNEVSLAQKAQRHQLIKENNFRVDQQWTVYAYRGYLQFWETVIEPVVTALYPDLTDKNIKHESKFTLYQNGDFTDVHKDSEAPGRKCAFLIYLSEPSFYNDGGGRLLLGTNRDGSYLQDVLPLAPNYVIIDIEKHSLYHSVELVKNDFRRFAFLDFVWNVDQMTEERKTPRPK